MNDLISKTVDFLEHEEALRLGESPWPTLEQEETAYVVSWDDLFPGKTYSDFPEEADENDQAPFWNRDPLLNPEMINNLDPWEVEVSEDFLGELGGIISIPEHQRVKGLVLNMDICAWYQPVHFYGFDWGIYIRESCIQQMALHVAAFLPYWARGSVPTAVLQRIAKACIRAGFAIFYLHEAFHHKTECFGIRNHVVRQISVYLPYFKNVYSSLKGTDDLLEEALANADMWRRLGTKPYKQWLGPTVFKAARKFLSASFPMEPKGYRQAVKYLDAGAFNAGENLLQGQIHEASPTPFYSTARWDLAPRMLQSFLPITSDIYTVVRAGQFPIFGSITSLPKTCSTGAMIKLAENRGWKRADGGKGSHVKLKKPNSPVIILPGNRKELSLGVAKQILRILGGYALHELPDLLKGVGIGVCLLNPTRNKFKVE